MFIIFSMTIKNHIPLIRNLLERWSGYLFPCTCILCKLPSNEPRDLCSFCESNLPKITQYCRQCANPIPEHLALCGMCLKNPPYFDKTIALFHYQHPIDKLIQGLKFSHQLVYAKVLGELLANLLNETYENPPQCIIPVPLHRKRLQERGFNQAIEIAKPISKKLKIPIYRLNAKRIRHTDPQAKTHADSRHQNVKNAFIITKEIPFERIAVIDDVVTTGHTVNEFCKTLKNSGVKEIHLWCCARTSR